MPDFNELTKLERQIASARERQNARIVAFLIVSALVLVVGGLRFPFGGRLFDLLLPTVCGILIVHEFGSALWKARLESKLAALRGAAR